MLKQQQGRQTWLKTTEQGKESGERAGGHLANDIKDHHKNWILYGVRGKPLEDFEHKNDAIPLML